MQRQEQQDRQELGVKSRAPHSRSRWQDSEPPARTKTTRRTRRCHRTLLLDYSTIDVGCRRRKLCCAPVVVACLGICCGSRATVHSTHLLTPKWPHRSHPVPLLLSGKYFLRPRTRGLCVLACWCTGAGVSALAPKALTPVPRYRWKAKITKGLYFFFFRVWGKHWGKYLIPKKIKFINL